MKRTPVGLTTPAGVFLALLVTLLSSPVPVCADSPLPENPKVGTTGYIQYWPGELPVVLAAPHGGRLLPKDIPNRPYGKLLRDTGTLELAVEMRAAMLKQYGRAPHLVVCQLARVKLDCNREVREAAQGNSKGQTAWEEYHGFLRDAESAVMSQYGKGIFLDIHGHAHPKARIELGYLLKSKELQQSDQQLNAPDMVTRSSIRLLAGQANVSFAALIRGSTSFGALLEQRGFSCVPSPSSQLEPDDLYFNGGYSTETHGSRDGVGLDAIQMETPGAYRDTAVKRVELSRAVSDALASYFTSHFQMKLEASPAVEKSATR
ncbi:hypothetical protein [Verrucomicrobium sp. BvORR106]|uniref:hypothetical protein n=1 Tax=Verrucomicrobium sp. BvORR106 TaxID=1403819 RepID=UPI000570A6D9|nr:hypothetical protein [Verrucomicrobium sp. BvORR106]